MLTALLKAAVSFAGSRHKPQGRSWPSELLVRTLQNLVNSATARSLSDVRKTMNVPPTKRQLALCTVSEQTLGGVVCLHLHAATSRSSKTDNQCANPEAVLIYLHGGAYIAGSANGFQGFVAELVSLSGCIAIVPDYRLAPEHPMPAGIDDCLAVIKAVSQQYPNAEIVLAGDSAGGGLSLACALHDDLQTSKLIARLVLISPWVNPNADSGSIIRNANTDFLCKAFLDYGFEAYLGDSGADKNDPRVDFSNADCAALPACYIQFGDAELFCDQIQSFCDHAARQSPNAVHYDRYEGQPHDFQIVLTGTPKAKSAIEKMALFIKTGTVS